MADRNTTRGPDARDDWAARIAALDEPVTAARTRKAPITVDRILDTAFAIAEAEGADALTMRRVAAELQTGPASLYAHVRNKAELDDLMIGRLCAKVTLPAPDARRWQTQIVDVCSQLRDEFLRYPGISGAALAAAPTSVDTLQINEGMLAILLTGGVSAQSAAWAIDAAYLYVCAYCLEASYRRAPGEDRDERSIDKAEIVQRLQMLPASRFPHTVEYAEELSAGEGHERFDFTLNTLFRGLAQAK